MVLDRLGIDGMPKGVGDCVCEEITGPFGVRGENKNTRLNDRLQVRLRMGNTG